MEALVPEPSTVKDNLQCPKCNKKFNHKRSLKRHLKDVCGTKSHSEPSAVEGNLQCPKCNKKFNHKRSLKRHLKNVCGTKSHSELSTVEGNWQCPKCNKKFKDKKILAKHLKCVCGTKSHYACNRCLKVFTCEEYLKYHIYAYVGQCKRPENKSECELSDNSLSENKNLSCHICLKGFPCEQDLNKHVKTEHGENIDAISSTESNSIEYKKTNFFCNEQGCNNQNFPSLKSFREHLIRIHEMNMNKSTHRFSSCKDFNEWKDDLCDKLGVEYFIKSVWQKTNSKYILYYCNRSGKYKPRSTGKKRLKVQDSRKIGQNCSSTMRLVITDGVYNLEYFEDHYGHALGSSNLAHTTLPESTKILVAEMLHNKVPRKSIPKMIRENDSMGERSKLIKYQDVLNIENRHEKEIDDRQPSEEIEDILKQIIQMNKSDKISNRLRQIVKTQLTQTLAMMNDVTQGRPFHLNVGGKAVILRGPSVENMDLRLIADSESSGFEPELPKSFETFKRIKKEPLDL